MKKNIINIKNNILNFENNVNYFIPKIKEQMYMYYYKSKYIFIKYIFMKKN